MQAEFPESLGFVEVSELVEIDLSWIEGVGLLELNAGEVSEIVQVGYKRFW